MNLYSINIFSCCVALVSSILFLNSPVQAAFAQDRPLYVKKIDELQNLFENGQVASPTDILDQIESRERTHRGPEVTLMKSAYPGFCKFRRADENGVLRDMVHSAGFLGVKQEFKNKPISQWFLRPGQIKSNSYLDKKKAYPPSMFKSDSYYYLSNKTMLSKAFYGKQPNDPLFPRAMPNAEFFETVDSAFYKRWWEGVLEASLTSYGHKFGTAFSYDLRGNDLVSRALFPSLIVGFDVMGMNIPDFFRTTMKSRGADGKFIFNYKNLDVFHDEESVGSFHLYVTAGAYREKMSYDVHEYRWSDSSKQYIVSQIKTLKNLSLDTPLSFKDLHSLAKNQSPSSFCVYSIRDQTSFQSAWEN